MRDSDVDLYTFERLRDEFGSFTSGDSDDLGRAQRELIGSRYREILRELSAIVSYQWKEHMERSALKGFLFHGGVGVMATPRSRSAIFSSMPAMGKAAAIIATTTIPSGERLFCSTMSNLCS